MAESIWRRQMNWASFVAREHELNDPSFRAESLEAARAVMRQARDNVKLIVDRLYARNYQFELPDYAYRPPPVGVETWGDELAGRGIHLPIAFQAWVEIVGTICLMGADPAWPQSGHSRSGSREVWHTDPLVVFADLEYVLSEYKGWQFRRDSFADARPFAIPFSPDDIHKAGFSGGAPYSLRADFPTVDSLVLNERHGFSFTAYLRHAFTWGGFPGFEVIDDRPAEFLQSMLQGLVEI